MGMSMRMNEEVLDIEINEFDLQGNRTIASELSIIEQEVQRSEKHLSKEQEREIVRHYQQTGNEEVLLELIDNHKGYLEDLADRYHRLSGVGKNDLRQQAKLGLVRGIKKFDLDKYDTKVLTYAGYWVLAEVQRYSTLNRTIQGRPSNMSVKMRELFKRYKTLMAEHTKNFGADPLTPEQKDDFEKKLGCDLDKIGELKALYFAPGVSLNKPLSRDEDQNTTFLDILQDERESSLDKVERKSHGGYLERLINIAELTEKEKFMIELRYLNEESDEEVTLKQVGDMLGVSRERARQIEASALGKMREAALNNPSLRQAAIDWERGSVERLEKAGYGSKRVGVSAVFKSQTAKKPPSRFIALEAAFKKVCEEENGHMAAVNGHNDRTYEMAYD